MKRGINGGNTEATTKTANNKICSCAQFKRISPIYQELTIIYILVRSTGNAAGDSRTGRTDAVRFKADHHCRRRDPGPLGACRTGPGVCTSTQANQPVQPGACHRNARSTRTLFLAAPVYPVRTMSSSIGLQILKAGQWVPDRRRVPVSVLVVDAGRSGLGG